MARSYSSMERSDRRTSSFFQRPIGVRCLIAAVRPAGQRARQNRGARSESLRSKQFLFVARRARTPGNRPTSCETNHTGQSRVRAMRSSRGIFSSRHNNKVGRATKGAAPDASARIGFSTPEFRFADCRRRSLCPKIRPDTMRATFQKHRCRVPSRQCGRKWNKANFSVSGVVGAQCAVGRWGLEFRPT